MLSLVLRETLTPKKQQQTQLAILLSIVGGRKNFSAKLLHVSGSTKKMAPPSHLTQPNYSLGNCQMDLALVCHL